MISFKEYLIEAQKMRTDRGNEWAIPLVKKAQKFSDSIGLSDSRILAGIILDWCKQNKVKFADLVTKVGSGEIDMKVAKSVFYRKNPFGATGSKSQDTVLEILRA